jgi:hypothetical protein
MILMRLDILNLVLEFEIDKLIFVFRIFINFTYLDRFLINQIFFINRSKFTFLFKILILCATNLKLHFEAIILITNITFIIQTISLIFIIRFR